MKNQQVVKRASKRARNSQGEVRNSSVGGESYKNPRAAMYSQLSNEMRACFYTANSLQIAPRVWDEVFRPQDKILLGTTLEDALRTFGDITAMWVKVHGGTLPRAAVEILFALEEIGARKRQLLMQQLGEGGEDSEETMEIAVQSGCLVLTDSPPQAYWKRKEIHVKWDENPKLWEYFFAVCEAFNARDRLDAFTFEGGARTLTNRKSRLLKTNGFPATLAARFGTTKATANTLNLQPGEVRIFDRNIHEEWIERRVTKNSRQ